MVDLTFLKEINKFDINKTTATKECDFFNYWYFLN